MGIGNEHRIGLSDGLRRSAWRPVEAHPVHEDAGRPRALRREEAMVAETRPRFRLQLKDLTAMDVAKIHAFLRVGHDRFGCDWSVVHDGACDVLVSGERGSAHAADCGAAAALWVSDALDPQAPDALLRPLQYDAFIDALKSAERALAERATAPAASPPRTHRGPGARLSLPSGAGLRLLRWPPASILGTHRYNVRLASFMSGRHILLEELVELSNVDRSRCEQFLAELNDARILDVKLPETTPRQASLSARGMAPALRHAGGVDGLFMRIRSRLRLGGPA
jgi:hypothetical protein